MGSAVGPGEDHLGRPPARPAIDLEFEPGVRVGASGARVGAVGARARRGPQSQPRDGAQRRLEVLHRALGARASAQDEGARGPRTGRRLDAGAEAGPELGFDDLLQPPGARGSKLRDPFRGSARDVHQTQLGPPPAASSLDGADHEGPRPTRDRGFFEFGRGEARGGGEKLDLGPSGEGAEDGGPDPPVRVPRERGDRDPDRGLRGDGACAEKEEEGQLNGDDDATPSPGAERPGPRRPERLRWIHPTDAR